MSSETLWSLLLVLTISALAPIVTRLIPGRRPQVLFLILGGVLIGPHVLGLADIADIGLVSGLGLGFLFLRLPQAPAADRAARDDAAHRYNSPVAGRSA